MNYKEKFKQHNDIEIEKKQPKLDFSSRLDFVERTPLLKEKKAWNWRKFCKFSMPIASLACVVLIVFVAILPGGSAKSDNAASSAAPIVDSTISEPAASISSSASAMAPNAGTDYSYGDQESLAPSKNASAGLKTFDITSAGTYILKVTSGDGSKLVVYKMINNGTTESPNWVEDAQVTLTYVASKAYYTLTLETGRYCLYQNDGTATIIYELTKTN